MPEERIPPAGPLVGVRVVEFAGAGPGPFCAMLLSDLGADIVRIDRPDGFAGLSAELTVDVPSRGRASLVLDLKAAADRDLALAAMAQADVVIEGFRPGVMERLGLGPDAALARNPRLVYGRVTGWGQTGPLSQTAGHDINYIALTGALAAIGGAARPRPPLNLVGDFGGGALYLAFGLVAALFERNRSGRGQVVEAAIVDGVASMMAVFSGMLAVTPNALADGRLGLAGDGANYRCYECADGRFVAVGAIEPKFRETLSQALDLDPGVDLLSTDPAVQAKAVEALSAAFRTRPRDAWRDLLQDLDACVTPVLGLDEAPEHAHMRARGVYVTVDGVVQPAPSPRFSRTPGAVQGPEPAIGAGGRERLAAWGVTSS